ncbi:hypothetical protein OS493_029263 [Desmophyllum pertusum]|uniref:Uncharacterized protein n=1 Tax=Desmophyllum pertusum TaxID=174260 RepID=A0A9W9ZKA9_9CNID|nr:hypothetical protein OS493_029263 [Desmophyllum pertusum]
MVFLETVLAWLLLSLIRTIAWNKKFGQGYYRLFAGTEQPEREVEEMSDVNEDVDETNATNYLGAFTNVDLKYLKLSEIPQDLEDRLVKKLDVRRKGERRYGWQKVGAEFKICNDDLEYLKIEYKRENGSPTSTLLSILGIRKGKTVSDLVNVLQRPKVKLADVASLIRRYIKAAK